MQSDRSYMTKVNISSWGQVKLDDLAYSFLCKKLLWIWTTSLGQTGILSPYQLDYLINGYLQTSVINFHEFTGTMLYS